MANTHSIFRLFVAVSSQAQGAPIVDRGITVEKEGAMRTGRCLVIRPPFTKHRPVLALVVGIWRKQTGWKLIGIEESVTSSLLDEK